MERRRVVITGLGAVTPIGLTAGESWQAVKNGVCGIGPITHYDPAAQKVKLAAEVKGFDPEALLGRQESKRMGRFTQFAVAAAREALSDAGFSAAQAAQGRAGGLRARGSGCPPGPLRCHPLQRHRRTGHHRDGALPGSGKGL